MANLEFEGVRAYRITRPRSSRCADLNERAPDQRAPGGTLGILIPSSIILVFYAMLTEQSLVLLIGAEFYSSFLALSQLPQALSEWIGGLGMPPFAALLTIVLVYLVLGCAMDALGMILVTVPVFLPVMLALDFGLSPEAVIIWFGIIVLCVVEVGLITPPSGRPGQGGCAAAQPAPSTTRMSRSAASPSAASASW